MALFLSFLWLNNIPSIHLLTDGKIQFEQRENKLQKNICIMIQLIYNFESVTLNNKLFRNIYAMINQNSGCWGEVRILLENHRDSNSSRIG